MSTPTTDQPLTADLLYPLFVQAQRLGAPLTVREADSDGDVWLEVFGPDGEGIETGYIYAENLELSLKQQYLIMGVLMDWLTLLSRETGCKGCGKVQQAMGRAWAEGGFRAMLEAFNSGVTSNGINNCADMLRRKRDGERIIEPSTDELKAELARVREQAERAEAERDEAREKLKQVFELVRPKLPKLADMPLLGMVGSSGPLGLLARAAAAEEQARLQDYISGKTDDRP